MSRDEHLKQRAGVHHDRYEDAMRAARIAADPELRDTLYDEACIELALSEALHRAADGYPEALDDLASRCTEWLGEQRVGIPITQPHYTLNPKG